MVFLAVICAGALGQVRSPAGFPLEAESEEIDFGVLEPLEVREFELWFTNPGDAPVTIRRAQVSCPCMVTVVPNGPVGAGERGKVLIIMEGPQNEIGPMEKKFVTVFSFLSVILLIPTVITNKMDSNIITFGLSSNIIK